jgi:hypothetical protein
LVVCAEVLVGIDAFEKGIGTVCAPTIDGRGWRDYFDCPLLGFEGAEGGVGRCAKLLAGKAGGTLLLLFVVFFSLARFVYPRAVTRQLQALVSLWAGWRMLTLQRGTVVQPPLTPAVQILYKAVFTDAHDSHQLCSL